MDLVPIKKKKKNHRTPSKTGGLSYYLLPVYIGSSHSGADSWLNLQVQSFGPASPHFCYSGTCWVGNAGIEQGHPEGHDGNSRGLGLPSNDIKHVGVIEGSRELSEVV